MPSHLEINIGQLSPTREVTQLPPRGLRQHRKQRRITLRHCYRRPHCIGVYLRVVIAQTPHRRPCQRRKQRRIVLARLQTPVPNWHKTCALKSPGAAPQPAPNANNGASRRLAVANAHAELASFCKRKLRKRKELLRNQKEKN